METTNQTPSQDRWGIFENCRGRLFRIALRMLGSVAEAEDVLQETALRWLKADVGAVLAPEGWLVSVLTRLSVDRLRQTAKEARTDPSLVASPDCDAPDRPLERSSDLATAFLVLRERLEPAARTAFLLRDVFDCDYGEIARELDKSEMACRQIVHRARERVRQQVSRLGSNRGALAGQHDPPNG